MQEEIFNKSIMGYNKEDVNNYIDNLMTDNRRVVKVKEDSIQNLQKKVSELELNVMRLKEVENHFLSAQAKLQQSTHALEEKNKEIDHWSLKVDELQEKLNQINETVGSDHSREKALEVELMLLKNEFSLVRKERDELRFTYNQLKENGGTAREKELRIEALENQLRDYHKDIEALKEKEALLENEKILIGNSIIRAQEKATEMDKQFIMQYGIESEKLQNYMSEIDAIRMKAVEVLQWFDSELNLLSNKGSSLTTTRIEPETVRSSHSTDTSDSMQIQLVKRG